MRARSRQLLPLVLVASLDVDRNGPAIFIKRKEEGSEIEQKALGWPNNGRDPAGKRGYVAATKERARERKEMSSERERGWRVGRQGRRRAAKRSGKSRGCSGQSSDRRAWNKTQLSPPNFDFRGAVTRKTFSGQNELGHSSADRAHAIGVPPSSGIE